MLPVQNIDAPKNGFGYIETFVSPMSAPYLTSSSKGMVWVETPRRGNLVWSILSPYTPQELFEQACSLVKIRSEECEWGSVVSSDEDAKKYLSDYNVGEVDFLEVGSHRVGVPSNRAFLGLCWGADPLSAMLIHDPSRMMTFVCAG